MDASRSPNPTQATVRPTNRADLLVSLLTAPVLLGILGTHALAKALQEMGLTSEELFRGERLPSLTLSPPP